MAEFSKEPLPMDYYKAEAWHKNLVGFYADSKQWLPREVLDAPMESLTHAISDAIDIYGNFPEIIYNALAQCIDGTFYPDEYRDKVLQMIYDAADDEGRPGLIVYADGLLAIRCLFEREKDFYKTHFSSQIAATEGQGDNSKFTKFAETIQKITVLHVNQIRRMISERK